MKKARYALVNQIKESRKKQGLTLRRLAGMADVPVASISRAERGFELTTSNAIKIARALGIRTDEVFQLVGNYDDDIEVRA